MKRKLTFSSIIILSILIGSDFTAYAEVIPSTALTPKNVNSLLQTYTPERLLELFKGNKPPLVNDKLIMALESFCKAKASELKTKQPQISDLKKNQGLSRIKMIFEKKKKMANMQRDIEGIAILIHQFEEYASDKIGAIKLMKGNDLSSNLRSYYLNCEAQGRTIDNVILWAKGLKPNDNYKSKEERDRAYRAMITAPRK